MAHILFGDMSSAGLHTLRAALRLGHEVTLLLGRSERHYVVDDAFRALLDRVGAVVEVQESADVGELVPAIAAAHRRLPVDAVISQCDPMMEALARACEQLGLRYTPRAASATPGTRTGRGSWSPRRAWRPPGTRWRTARGRRRRGRPLRLPGRGEAGQRAGQQVRQPRRRTRRRRPRRRGDPRGRARPRPARAAARPARPRRPRRGVPGGRAGLRRDRRARRRRAPVPGVRALRGRDNDCVEIGAVLPADLPADVADECFDYAERVCAALGLDFGVFHVEIMLTPRGPVLVEVNPG
ncbi:hypothetical protein ACFQV2_25615 [Actinokineospora soli]|uniref:BL00235/CARNS1 N-terminal domain-containing protein n=1 Tax=Actinokineospora soli TaxID=1048753 RepID=A0ABW2TSN3_9PSEU